MSSQKISRRTGQSLCKTSGSAGGARPSSTRGACAPKNCSGRRAACEGLNNRIFQFEVADDIIARAMKKLKFVVEKHRDGYVAYPLGLKGAVVGQGQSYESALADAKSAAAFHIKSFGKEAFDDQDDVMEAFVTEASLTAG